MLIPNTTYIIPVPRAEIRMEAPTEKQIVAMQSEMSSGVGNYLRDKRKAHGYRSYENFAYDHDQPVAQYWRVERGLSNITFRSLSRILAIYQITLEEYYYEMWQREKEKNAIINFTHTSIQH